MGAYGPLPRDVDGKIIVGPLPLIDTTNIEDVAPAVAAAPPVEDVAAPQQPVGSPQRRAGTTPTPFGLLRPGAATIPPNRLIVSWIPWVIMGLLVALFAWALFMNGQAGDRLPRSAATPAAAALAPATLPVPAVNPTVSPTVAALARAIVAYDAPGGSPIGALEPGRSYQMIEERNGWRQLAMTPGGAIWARTWEMDGIPPPTPTPTELPPSLVPAPPLRPAYQPPRPTVRCKDVVLDGVNLGQACGGTDAEIWAEAARMTEAAGARIVPTAWP
jgi:hypothetical protein